MTVNPNAFAVLRFEVDYQLDLEGGRNGEFARLVARASWERTN
jgi:hypothetical protein